MSRLSALAITSAATLAVFATQSSRAQVPPDPNNNMIFSAEFANQPGRRNPEPALEVVFYGVQPRPELAEEVVRTCQSAAALLRPATNFVARAWFATSPTDTNRRVVALRSGSNVLRYVARDAAIPSEGVPDAGAEAPETAQAPPGTAPSPTAATAPPVETAAATETTAATETAAATGTAAATDTAAATVVEPAEEQAAEEAPLITEDPTVVQECKNVPPDRVSMLVDIGSQTTSAERKHVVKAMRTWCKENEVAIDRDLRNCLSAVSKTIVASRGPAALTPEEMAAAVTRGTEAYRVGQCATCHQNSGRGGPRGPNLTDGEWLHGNRNLESIRRVLVSGVPQNRLKDANRPAPMDPATNLITDDAQITDLAAYVLSLSQE